MLVVRVEDIVVVVWVDWVVRGGRLMACGV
jgi:hypothetical protein